MLKLRELLEGPSGVTLPIRVPLTPYSGPAVCSVGHAKKARADNSTRLVALNGRSRLRGIE